MIIQDVCTNRMYQETATQYHAYLEDALSREKTFDGYYCRLVEEELCKAFDVPYASLTTSGSTALSQIAFAKGLKAGDEIVVTPYACGGVFMPFAAIGLKLKFCDLNEYGVIDGNKLQSVITENTKAIVSTNMWGITTDYDKFVETGLPIISDSCQWVSSHYKGTPTTQLNDLIAISFGRRKELPTYGTYGAVLCHNEKYLQLLESTKFNGMSKTGTFYESLGLNGEPSEDKAVSCLIALKYRKPWARRRFEIAEMYNELCRQYGIKYMIPPEYSDINYQKYVVFVKDRNKTRKDLNNINIPVKNYYPIAANQSGLFESADLPGVDKFMQTALCLPIDPWYTDDEVYFIFNSLLNVIKDELQ